MSQLMMERSFEITDIKDNSSQYPGITMGKDKKVHVCWQEYKNRQDTVYGGELVNGKVEKTTRISGTGQALRPVIICWRDAVWYAWSEQENRGWSILARYYRKGSYSPVITVARGEALFYPAFFIENDSLKLLYNDQGKGYSNSVICKLNEDGASEIEIVSAALETYRPTGCQGGDGRTYIVYDSFQKDHYDIFVRVRTEKGWSEEMRINSGGMWAARPCVTSCVDGACVCWYEYGERAAFAYCTIDLHTEGDLLVCGSVETLSSNKNWYHDISVSSNEVGTCVFAYTWGKYNINVRYRKNGGVWSEPVVMSYDDTHCGVHPYVYVDGEDTIHLLWQFAHKNGHLERNACIVYNAMNIAEMDLYYDKVVEKSIDQFVQPIPAEKRYDKRTGEEVSRWLKKNGYGDKKLVFGDIHGQSGISDGVGEIDQYYHYASAIANLDFTALTDHDCYPDWISQSEWEWMRTTNCLMNTDGKLSCLLAYEWTPNEYRYDYGHKNVYYRGDEGDIFRSGDIGGMTPFKLFESVKRYGAMAFPHHPSANWGLVSAATDWNFHDSKVQRLVEIYSRHANFEDFESTSIYTKNIAKLKGCSGQDALARKYHIGFTAGSDSHQMEHGIEGGIFATFVSELTRENVFDALYDRFTYATTGARILASLRIGTAHMGQEVAVKRGEAVMLNVSVMGTDHATVQIIKNNQKVMETDAPNGVCDFTWTDSRCERDDYYYVRVLQKDEHMAWTSPIWIEEEIS